MTKRKKYNPKKPSKKNPAPVARKKRQQTKTFLFGRRYIDLIGLSIIIILGIIIYSNSFNCSFHLDDNNSIIENTKIRDLSNLKAIWDYSHTRFLGYLSFATNYHFSELNVWGYHLVNLIIHIINACLVYWLVVLLFTTASLKDISISKDKKMIALFTALFFVSHPLATQSVTYIVQRFTSLCALFYLLSIILYIKARLPLKNNSIKYAIYTASFFSAILAMLTKENAYTLPFAIILIELFFLRTKKLAINFKDFKVISLLSALLAFVLWAFINFSSNIFKTIIVESANDFRSVNSVSYLLSQFSVIPKYIGLLILPVNQNLDYEISISHSFFDLRTFLGFIFLASLIALSVFFFKRNRIVSFGILWFFLTLSIESSIIPIGDLMFEHRTYLPSVGFFLILSSSIYFFLMNRSRNIAIAVFAIIIGAYSFLTFERNKIWKDDLSLWSDVISKSPNKARAFNSRGNYYLNNNKPGEALKDFNKAIELKPTLAKAYFNRGTLFFNQKRNEQALQNFSKAIELKPNFFEAYINRANYLRENNRLEEALADYYQANRINPGNIKMYNNRGVLYIKQQKYDLALQDFDSALQIDPKYYKAYANKAAVYVDLKNYSKVIEEMTNSLTINPEYGHAYYWRAIAKARLDQADAAIPDFSKAIELQPGMPNYYYQRSLSYKKLGKLSLALQDAIQARNLGANVTAAYIQSLQ